MALYEIIPVPNRRIGGRSPVLSDLVEVLTGFELFPRKFISLWTPREDLAKIGASQIPCP